MRPLLALGSLLLVASAAVPAHASTPPPPPPPPGCNTCPGPPSPPTPVPTLGPTRVDGRVDIAVHLSPARVHRGKVTALRVAARTGDHLTVVLRYHQGRPRTIHARVVHRGVLIRRWRIPRWAPIGAGTIRVVVAQGGKTYKAWLHFTVLR